MISAVFTDNDIKSKGTLSPGPQPKENKKKNPLLTTAKYLKPVNGNTVN